MEQSDSNLANLEAYTIQLKEEMRNTLERIKNNPPIVFDAFSGEVTKQITLAYAEGVGLSLAESENNIIPDENIHVCQYLSQIKDRISEYEESIAFHKGVICDLDAEILRYESRIETLESALQGKTNSRTEITLQEKKNQFTKVKQALHETLENLYGQNAEDIRELIQELTALKLDKESEEYLDITTKNIEVVNLLKIIKLVRSHPYDKTKIKLAFE